MIGLNRTWEISVQKLTLHGEKYKCSLFWRQFHQHFTREFFSCESALCSISVCFVFEIFWRKNIGAKCAP
jgi:hypothetical protein